MRNILLFLVFTISGYAQSDVSLTINIQNQQTDSIVISNARQTIKKVIRSRSGIFKTTLQIPDGFYYMEDGYEGVTLYLKKGYTLNVFADGKQLYKSIRFEGTGEKENNFLAEKRRSDIKFSHDNAHYQTKKNYGAFRGLFIERMKTLWATLDQKGFDEMFINGVRKEEQQEFDDYKEIFDEILGIKKAGVADLKGKPAPSFKYENYKGGTTSLSDFKGKYVYIDIWASWCKPCLEEFADLKILEAQYGGKNIAFVGISVDKAREYQKWRSMVATKNPGGTQLIADKEINSDFIKAFGVSAVPRYIIISPNGIVVESDAKRPSDVFIRNQLDQLLK